MLRLRHRFGRSVQTDGDREAAATVPIRPARAPEDPEWTTEQWKARVQGEARQRLRARIRDVSKRADHV
jgi:hypothetical protein